MLITLFYSEKLFVLLWILNDMTHVTFCCETFSVPTCPVGLEHGKLDHLQAI